MSSKSQFNWGKAWREHILRHLNFEGRFAAGKSLWRNGAVRCLEISEGLATATVLSDLERIVHVRIKPCDPERIQTLASHCAASLTSVASLLEGVIEPSTASLLTGEDGIFPQAQEVRSTCSCVEDLTICSHTAAVIESIGDKIKEDPLWFFRLRGIDPVALVATAVDNVAIGKTCTPGTQNELDLSAIFGVDVDQDS